MKRYTYYEPLPNRWLVAGICINHKGREFHFFRLKLPSWGYGYDIRRDGEYWGQRALLYHGHRGFRIQWLFKPQSEISMTPHASGVEQ